MKTCADSRDFASQARRLRLCFGGIPRHPNQTPPPEPDYASGTHHTSQSIRNLRHTRDRSRAEADLGVARSAPPVAAPGQQRFTPRRSLRDRPAWPARGGRAALRAAETIPPVELRRTGVSPGRLSVVSRIRAAADELDAKEGGAAEDHQRDHRSQLGGDQSGGGAQCSANQAGAGSDGSH